jgi:hypothetical protein
MMDRRRDPRYDRELEFGIKGLGGELLRARSVNISTRGLSCVVSHEIPAMSKLKVAMELPFESGQKGRLECEGVVVRSERQEDGDFNIAIYFLSVDRECAALITEYLEESSK